jgi:hypothetical protein
MSKIVFILPDLIPGGAERVVVNLANKFIKEDIQCSIILLKYTKLILTSKN